MKEKNFGKKVIATLCVLTLVLGMVACGSGNDTPPAEKPKVDDAAAKLAAENQLCA